MGVHGYGGHGGESVDLVQVVGGNHCGLDVDRVQGCDHSALSTRTGAEPVRNFCSRCAKKVR